MRYSVLHSQQLKRLMSRSVALKEFERRESRLYAVAAMLKRILSPVWSIVALSFFAPAINAASPAILINEIMYHPPGTNSLAQWFELYNPGTKSVSLATWHISKGVSFTFPANANIPAHGYLVVAADADTFRTLHPDTTNFVAGWTGKLGHTLELSDPEGKVVNAVEFYSEGDWATRMLGPEQYNHRGWVWYAPADGLGASLELINPSLPNAYAHNWLPNANLTSTPGRANSVASANAAPFVSSVSHWPVIPKASDPVTVNARVVDENSAALTVMLNWRLDGQTSFTQTRMFDDGGHDDGTVGDGVYGGAIPPQANHTAVEFFITATDASGQTRVYPNYIPPQNSNRTANLLYQVDDGGSAGTQPIYRIIMTDAERAELHALGRVCPDSDSDAEMNATFISQDKVLSGGTTAEVRYNVGVRNRGHGTRQSNPNNYHINIPEDRLWKGTAGLNLNSQYAYSQVIGSAVMRESGVVMPDSRAVQVRVNSTNLMSLSLPDNNSFGSYAANEQYNNDFIKRAFPLDPDGNSYRGIRDQVLCVPSLGGVADLRWRGTDWLSYTNAYFKQNNFVANDWSDLIELIGVLNVTNGTTAVSYVRDVERVIDVEQWMRYMAANTLLDNNETALANGVGDDYALYRGAIDQRFQALPYDLDTVLGRGLTSVTPRDGLFRMTNLPTMDRLMKTPEFAPIYFAKLKELAETVFASEKMDPLIDQLLGGFVPADAINNMKAFNASHREYILSQIPLSLTVSNSLPEVSGYAQTTSGTASLSGSANAIETRKILVNGAPANWVAWRGAWDIGGLALNPGLNRLTVRALGTNDHEIARTNLDIWFDSGLGQNASGTMGSDTRWSATAGPYNISSSLTIAAGATLTISPGTTVYLGAGASLTVSDGGRLLAEGTEGNPIRFSRTPGSTAAWGGIVVDGSVGSPETKITYAHIEFNGSTAIHSSGGTLVLDHLTFGSTDHQYVSLDSSSFVVSNCHFPTPTAVFEPAHGTGGIKPGGHGVFYRNYFGAPTGYSDVVDFTGGQRGGPVVYFIDNVFTGSGDDGVDLDGTDAWVEGNIFMHIHQNGAPDSSSAISGGNDSGETSEVTIIGNLIFDCDDAATAKQGNFFTLLNNTIVHTTKAGGTDFASGIVNVRDTTPSFTTFGKGYYLEGNIITDADTLVRNYDPQQVTVTFNNNILPTPWDGPGTNNYIGDALLAHIPTVAEAQFSTWEQAQIMREWFSLRPGSPGRGSGPVGKDKGGVVPRGVYISAPTGTNSSSSAVLQVGVNRQGFGIPATGWPEGAGYTAYKWRLDGGTWSPEVAINTPINLIGLANGPHSVEVVGKNDAGLYQNDSLFGPEAMISTTGTWFVDTNAPSNSLSVRLNEILAKHSNENINFGTPDLVELYNYGTNVVDLSGAHLTTDLSQPFAFTVPNGTRLAAGGFLVLIADTDAASEGIHLGFKLNGEGDSLYLLDKSLVPLDAVTFGLQVADYSIGRSGGGEWTLCIPTLGSANIAQALGDPGALKINEWLADAEFSAPDSFLELYNPQSEPVALGGLYLSDAAGAPDRFAIAPLSFMAGRGFAVFNADGNAGTGASHLNFKLSGEVGLIRLSAPDGSLIDGIEYGPQATDVSEGRSPNGASFVTFFQQPTPGASNPGVPGSSGGTNVTRTNITLVTLAGEWRYNETGTDLGTAWRASGYNDAAWPSGKALFYHGNAAARMPLPVATQLTFRSPEQSTYYFRTHFSYTGPTTNVTLSLTQVIDDGMVVYLNGSEIYRRNMPAGTVNYSTFASSTVSDATQNAVGNVPAVGLVEGDNVLAVEVHQANLNSSDIAMAIALDAVISQTNIIAGSNSAVDVHLNELLAKTAPRGGTNVWLSDWLELYNAATNSVNLAGMSLSDDLGSPEKWIFPQGSSIAAGGRLVIALDGESAANTTNTGFNVDQDGGTVYLFDSPDRGGSLLDSLRYGIQVPNLSISRVPDGSGEWVLSSPTPGAPNEAQSLGSPSKLRINEWMASSSQGSDWFELFNGDLSPVALGGLYLTDDLTDRANFHIEPLSFIGSGVDAFVRFEADGAPENGARHAGFNLSAKGEEIGLFNSDGNRIDAIVFGAQTTDVSQGHLPDGTGPITDFPNSASPGASNYLPITNAVINEVFSNPSVPFEQAIELYNPSNTPLDIGGWYLSDSEKDLKKFRLPVGTTLAAGGYAVFYENQFGGTATTPLKLDPSAGGTVVLSATDSAGNLTGYRTFVKFGAAEQNISFGRVPTSTGFDFTALSAHTFGADSAASVTQFRTGKGASNSPPKIGPIVISEIMPYAVIGSVEEENLEFIEIENISTTTQPLYDAATPTNSWALQTAVRFDFPTNSVIPPGGRALIVGFDPSNTAVVDQFRSRYSVPETVRLYGPWKGHLDNVSETVELTRPGIPVGSYVPAIVVDHIDYSLIPWPLNSLPGFHSLQRISSGDYGNDRANWKFALPNPGRPNEAAAGDSDNDGLPDAWELSHFGSLLQNGSGDFDGDGLTNKQEFIAGTDPANAADALKVASISYEGAAVILRFHTVAGKSYQIDYRNDLASGSWQNLTTLTAAVTGQSEVTDNALQGRTRFYRIVLQ